MIIDLLYFEGCPSYKNALAVLETVIASGSLAVTVKLTEVRSESEAEKWRFLGSPSFQIEGKDLWPEERTNYSMSCRIYRTAQGLKGWPTAEMLRHKIFTLLDRKDLEK
ncbi:MAG: DF family (seleno)protein [Bellilinea sp.]